MRRVVRGSNNPVSVRSLRFSENLSTVQTLSQLAALRQNPKAKVVALSGYKYYAADDLGGPDADVIMFYTNRSDGTFGPTSVPGHVPPASVLNAPGLTVASRGYPLGVGDHLAMKLAGTAFDVMHQQVTLINLPEFDWPLGHVNGASLDQPGVKTLMQEFDQDLASLEDTYRRAGILDQILFLLTADHGFSTISQWISLQVSYHSRTFHRPACRDPSWPTR